MTPFLDELYQFLKTNYKWGIPATFGWLVMFLHGLKTRKFDIWTFCASLSAALLVGYLTQIICIKLGYAEYIGAACSLTGLMSDGIIRFWMNNNQNILIDYFYLNDLYLVLDYIIKNGGPKNINLVYKKKYNLLDIANLIQKGMNINNYPIEIKNNELGKNYVGNGSLLSKLPVYDKLTGLEEGIFKTCKELI